MELSFLMGERRACSACAGWRDAEMKISNSKEEMKMVKGRGIEAGACMAFNFKSICMPDPIRF